MARPPPMSAGPKTGSRCPVGAQAPQTGSLPTQRLPPTVSVLNGLPSLSAELDKDSRRTLTASGSLILKDVNFGDTAIYQCKASNTHGTILTNTNVYVIGVCCFLSSWSCSSVASISTWLTDFSSLCVFVFRAARPDSQRRRERVRFCGRPEGLAGVRDLRLPQAQSRVVRRRHRFSPPSIWTSVAFFLLRCAFQRGVREVRAIAPATPHTSVWGRLFVRIN